MSNKYIKRIISCGYPTKTAYIMYHKMSEMSKKCPDYTIEDFVRELENQKKCG